jgi:hypothetical protein
MTSQQLASFAVAIATASVGLYSLADVVTSEDTRRVAERVRLVNYPLNRHIRMLDGQWQGTFLASDGNDYVGGGSHNPNLGAALFRYEPTTT